jgi:hypothetical protein
MGVLPNIFYSKSRQTEKVLLWKAQQMQKLDVKVNKKRVKNKTITEKKKERRES